MRTPSPHQIPVADGVTIAAWDFPGDIPVLFCHATGFHSRIWDPVIASLGDRVRAIAIDARGHGDSRVPEGTSFDWTLMAHDILAVVDHFGLGQGVRVVGHSLGGGLSLLAESIRPGLFAQSWLFEPIAVPHHLPMGNNDLAESARSRREIFPNRDTAYGRYMSRPPFSQCDPGVIRRYVDYGFRDLTADELGTFPGDTRVEVGSVILKCRGAIEAEVFDQALKSDVYDRLSTVHTKATIIQSGDGGIPAQLAPQIKRAMPEATLIREEDLTHFGPFTHANFVAASIRQVLT